MEWYYEKNDASAPAEIFLSDSIQVFHMETIIARQPIFNQKKQVFAYELLYRGSEEMSLDNIGGERATSSLLTSSFLTEGIDLISGNKPCFINFTEDLLLENVAATFPQTNIVIEILEDVNPTPEIVNACKQLKKAGYTLALDDFIFDKKFYPLVELADIIKFDFRLTPVEEIELALKNLASYKLVYLAEKVETNEEFEKALAMGFTYFQGYFFAKPEVMRIKEVATPKVNLLLLISEISKKETSPEKMVEIIATDVSLSYKLLRYLNSSYFSLVNDIESISHAVSYLGEEEIQRFVTLVAISEIASDKPLELVRLASVRAKFCEELGDKNPQRHNINELFMLGLFSLLHTMFNMTMEEVLGKIPLSDNLRSALIQRSGPLSIFLETAIAYEKGDTDTVVTCATRLNIETHELYPIYLSAIRFGDSFANL